MTELKVGPLAANLRKRGLGPLSTVAMGLDRRFPEQADHGFKESSFPSSSRRVASRSSGDWRSTCSAAYARDGAPSPRGPVGGCLSRPRGPRHRALKPTDARERVPPKHPESAPVKLAPILILTRPYVESLEAHLPAIEAWPWPPACGGTRSA